MRVGPGMAPAVLSVCLSLFPWLGLAELCVEGAMAVMDSVWEYYCLCP
jgi:hypothetical protein